MKVKNPGLTNSHYHSRICTEANNSRGGCCGAIHAEKGGHKGTDTTEREQREDG